MVVFLSYMSNFSGPKESEIFFMLSSKFLREAEEIIFSSRKK